MNIRQQFEEDMRKIFIRAYEECNYRASRFLQMVDNLGGVEAAKKLILTQTDGFTRLYELNRLDLSVEYLVLKQNYSELFTEEECEICKLRLKAAKYPIENQVR
jgi:hypothetical protein